MSFANSIAIGKLTNMCRKSMLYFHPNVLTYNLAITPSSIKSNCRSNIHLLCEQREQEFKDILEDLQYISEKHHKIYEKAFPSTTSNNNDDDEGAVVGMTTPTSMVEPKYDQAFEITNFDDLIRCASMDHHVLRQQPIRLGGDMTQFPFDPLFDLIYNQLDVNSKRPISPFDTVYQMTLVLSNVAQFSPRACLGLDYFVEVVTYMFGDFHGGFSWECSDHYDPPTLLFANSGNCCTGVDLITDIPSLYQLESAGFSIRPIPCLVENGGIRTYCSRKSVDIQIVTLLDLRYRDFNFPPNSNFRGYHADTLIKLARLIPNKQSFDVALATGIIPENLRIDWTFWNDHIISEAYSYEASAYSGCIRKRSKATRNTLRALKQSYNRHTKRSFFGEIWDFMKTNRLEFLYSTIMLLFTFVSLLQLLVGLGILPPVQPSTVYCLPPPSP
ncbi:hypothetical protein BDA99DRAFT_203647 [Phascolomyces articulosus]|uniref:Uncharacterized protein n=1 Tax=Phascolomyces articulosus TaxID=60185 RepID=A0AAD5PA88_9FUNG|nr:hypothetical protein BDA99DRAFT_203647 [Phascolomyces articulosus]